MDKNIVDVKINLLTFVICLYYAYLKLNILND